MSAGIHKFAFSGEDYMEVGTLPVFLMGGWYLCGSNLEKTPNYTPFSRASELPACRLGLRFWFPTGYHI